MFRREFWILCGLATGMFLIVSFGAALVGYYLERDATTIALDSIPGLIDAGEASVITQEGWFRVELVAHAPPSEREEWLRTARSNSGKHWDKYQESIHTEEDATNYASLLVAQSNYFRLREEFFGLVQTGSAEEKQEFMEDKMKPAYERYQAASVKIFEYNVRMGRASAIRVIQYARLIPWVVCALGLLLFGCGLVIGMRAAFTGLTFASGMRKRP